MGLWRKSQMMTQTALHRMPPTPASAPLCPTWSGASRCAWYTVPDFVDASEKLPPGITSQRLSFVSRVDCLVCFAHALCFFTTSPRHPNSDRQKKASFFFPSLLPARNAGRRVQHECQFLRSVSRHGLRSLPCVQCSHYFHPACHMCATFSQESRDTDQGRSRNMSASFSGVSPVWNRRPKEGEFWLACTGTGVSTGGRAHSSALLAVRAKESHDVCTSFFWICVRRTIDCDLESQERKRKRKRENQKDANL